MPTNEDATTTAYPYAWFPESDLPLKDFLAKYKPSMVQDDGTKPWIWAHKTFELKSDFSLEAIAEAQAYLEKVTEKVEAIKNDESIPVRANKKKGTKSKKEVREEVQNEATEKLKDISVRHGYVSGKWLIFAPAERVDAVWSEIATSIVDGPLSTTCVSHAKVATSPKTETPNYQHVLCLYMPNVYDKAAVLEVMKVLLGKHGLSLSGVKSDLYTSVSLDSKHASGIQSTVWRNTALMKNAEMMGLRDKFFADLSASKTAALEVVVKAADDTESSAPKASSTKAKLKLKKKAVNDDPFASDDDDDAAEEKVPEPKGKTEKKPAPKPKASTSKRAKSESDDDEDEDPRPKKKRNGKK
ncbi:hypothetical protein EUX98_g1154 [Antrodiella citrinella]|uniref:Uncharacterized protein n=1 Tax=Antrodiella citrinella TaxID=2447956 RepID=A0A4S4N2B3_9APHY|nr:hypothetical protein EUX98_g1154 [Antrodiella citrinella]